MNHTLVATLDLRLREQKNEGRTVHVERDSRVSMRAVMTTLHRLAWVQVVQHDLTRPRSLLVCHHSGPIDGTAPVFVGRRWCSTRPVHPVVPLLSWLHGWRGWRYNTAGLVRAARSLRLRKNHVGFEHTELVQS